MSQPASGWPRLMLEAFTLNVTVLPGVANDWFGGSISNCGVGVACTGSVECIPARPRPITATKRIPNVRNAGIVSPNVTYGRKCLASKKGYPWGKFSDQYRYRCGRRGSI